MALTRRGFVAQWVEMNSNGAFLYFYEFISTLNSLINEQILYWKLQNKSHLLKESIYSRNQFHEILFILPSYYRLITTIQGWYLFNYIGDKGS